MVGLGGGARDGGKRESAGQQTVGAWSRSKTARERGTRRVTARRGKQATAPPPRPRPCAVPVRAASFRRMTARTAVRSGAGEEEEGRVSRRVGPGLDVRVLCLGRGAGQHVGGQVGCTGPGSRLQGDACHRSHVRSWWWNRIASEIFWTNRKRWRC